MITYISEWDSPESARQAFEMYKRVMQKRWKKLLVGHESPEEMMGDGDTGRFRVWLTGTTLESVEGQRAGPEH